MSDVTSSVVTVSQINGQIKKNLEGEFSRLTVEGEISNLSLSATGHYYFTLSDARSSLSCALFKGDALRNPLIRTLKNGQKILVSGSVSVYLPRGTYQLIARRVTLAGKGDLALRFEQLKAKLTAQGLFDIQHKKRIPSFPQKMAIITALHGAALQDFLNILREKHHGIATLIIPALVQGTGAPKILRECLQNVLQHHEITPIDTIIFARGGGSLEDLWAFNDEALIRDVFNCPIPVISAIGHQTDFTLMDYVADLRVETPSSAAMIITENFVTLYNRLIHLMQRLRSATHQILHQKSRELGQFKPEQILLAVNKRLQANRERFIQLNYPQKFQMYSSFYDQKLKLEDLSQRLILSIERRIEKEQSHLVQQWNSLNALGPKSVLQRGYALLRDESGHVISRKVDLDKVSKGSFVTVELFDGNSQLIKE